MPSTYTNSLKLVLPATGENTGTWGSLVNSDLTSLLDIAIAGYQSISMTDADRTLTNGNGSSPNEARYAFITMTGTLTAARNVIVPTASKIYYFRNSTTGGFALTLKTAAGTGISVPNGSTMLLLCDGTNVVDSVNTFSTLRATGTINNTGASFSGSAPANSLVLNSSGNLGVGTSSPVTVLHVSAANGGSSGTLSLCPTTAPGSNPSYILMGNSNSLGAPGPTYIASANRILSFGVGTSFSSPSGGTQTEYMRLDASGNLGIGTASITSRVHVVGTGQTIVRVKGGTGTGQGGAFYVEKANSGVTLAAFGDSAAIVGGTVDQAVTIYADASTPITFNQSSTEVMRLDASGNLGLGTTPSAWNSSYKAIQVSSATAISTFGGGQSNFSNNSFVAASGSWTSIAGGAATLYQQNSGQHVWYYTSSSIAGNAITFTQAMTLDASGNLGLGRTPSYKLDVASTLENGTPIVSLYNTNASLAQGYIAHNLGNLVIGNARTDSTFGQIIFAPRSTEAMRLDASGNLLVGKTLTSGGTAGVELAPGGQLIATRSGATAGYFNRLASDGALVSFNRTNVEVGTISVTTTATAYNTSSDQRLKTNIVDAPDAAALIDGIKVRSFNWKADGSHQRYGMVAQELVTVAPEAVHAPADPDEMMAVDYSKLVPMLVKEIQSLRTRVATLEARG